MTEILALFRANQETDRLRLEAENKRLKKAILRLKYLLIYIHDIEVG
jgi:hypothetical protein